MPYGEDRAGCRADNALGHAPHQQPAYGLTAVCADDDQVYVCVRCVLDDGLGRSVRYFHVSRRVKYCAVFVLRMGEPARQILEYLKEQPAIDLVVMATAGRGGVARLMMGSVADTIVRAAPCPVLTIHPPDHAERGSTYRAA